MQYPRAPHPESLGIFRPALIRGNRKTGLSRNCDGFGFRSRPKETALVRPFGLRWALGGAQAEASEANRWPCRMLLVRANQRSRISALSRPRTVIWSRVERRARALTHSMRLRRL